MQAADQEPTVVDADGLILGRMASAIAKRLLEGEKIAIVNADKAVISGKKRSRVGKVKKFLEVGHARKGPFHSRRPDRIVRRTVRGMLPYKQFKGKQAYKRLKVFIGVPETLKHRTMEVLSAAHAEKLKCPYFTIGDLAEEIGWKASE